MPGLVALIVQVPTLIAVTRLPIRVQYLVERVLRVVSPAVWVVVRSAVGFASESQLKSEIVSRFAAFAIVNERVTSLAGLWVRSPGLLAVILQMPEVMMWTVVLLTKEQMVGVTLVVVVTPALWVIVREISGFPYVTLVSGAKVMVVVGIVTACACKVAPKPIIRAKERVNIRLREVFMFLA